MKLVPPALACAALMAAIGAQGADVAVYSIIKERHFAQAGDAPAQAPGNAFRFAAAVAATSNGVVNSATVQRSTGGTVFALTNSTPPGVFQFAQGFASQAALDTAFPSASSYILAMQTGTDGPRSPQLSFGADAYPNAPRARSLATLQQIDALNPIQLGWDPLVNGVTNDVIQVLIEDGQSNTVFSSPLVGSPGALNGLATNVVLAANTLAPARQYTVTLIFARVQVNALNLIFAYPGVPGASVFAARTRYTIQTAPRHASQPPRLRVVSATSTAFTLAFAAEIGAAYRLIAATNPAQATWSTILSTNAAATNIVHTDAAAGQFPARYYRVVSP